MFAWDCSPFALGGLADQPPSRDKLSSVSFLLLTRTSHSRCTPSLASSPPHLSALYPALVKSSLLSNTTSSYPESKKEGPYSLLAN